jgi:hypothetical protein
MKRKEFINEHFNSELDAQKIEKIIKDFQTLYSFRNTNPNKPGVFIIGLDGQTKKRMFGMMKEKDTWEHFYTESEFISELINQKYDQSNK